jgi:predicted DNA binding protein
LIYVYLTTGVKGDSLTKISQNSSVTILDLKERREGFRCIIEVKADSPESFEEVASFFETIQRVSSTKALGVMSVKGEPFETVARYTIVNASVKGGKVRWILLINDYTELRSLLNGLIGKGIEARVDKVIKVKSVDPLTARQEQVLRIALEAGYYDFPRRINLKDLANKLGVSPSSLSEVLRRAERNALMRYFREREI